MTKFNNSQELHEWLCEHEHSDTSTFGEYYLSAIIGITEEGNLVYSYSKMVEQEMEDYGISFDDAVEYINYNAIRTVPYMKDKPPVIVYDMD